MAILVDVADSSFDAQVLKCDIPVLANFGAEWSGPCRIIASHIAELAAEYDGQLKVVNLDIEENPTVASDFSVLSIPTLVLFKFGQPVERMAGVVSKEEILAKVSPYLDGSP